MTSKDLKRPKLISESSYEVKLVKSKNRLKVGANLENNDECLDEILHNKIS